MGSSGTGTSGMRLPAASEKQILDRYIQMQRQQQAHLAQQLQRNMSNAQPRQSSSTNSGTSTSDRQAHVTQLANQLRMQAQSYLQQQMMGTNGQMQPQSPVLRHQPPGLTPAALAQMHRRQREQAAFAAQRHQAQVAHSQPSSSHQLLQHLPEHLRPEKMETARQAALNMQRQFSGRSDAISQACQELIELRDSLQNQLAAMKILMISEISRLFDCLSAAVVSETEEQLAPSKKLLKELKEKADKATKVGSCASQILGHYGKVPNNQLEGFITQTMSHMAELEQAEPLMKAALKDVIRLGKFDAQIDLSAFDPLFEQIKATDFGFFSVKNDDKVETKKFEKICIPECVPRLKLWDQLSTKKLTLRNQNLHVKRPYNDAQRGLLRMMFACFMRWFDTPHLPGTSGVDETPTIFWQNPQEAPREAPPKQIDLTGEGLGSIQRGLSTTTTTEQLLSHNHDQPNTIDSTRPSTSRYSEEQELNSQDIILKELREAGERILAQGTDKEQEQETFSPLNNQPIDFSGIQVRTEPLDEEDFDEDHCEMPINGQNHLENGSHSPFPPEEAEDRPPSASTTPKHTENGIRLEVARELSATRKCPSPASLLPARPSMVGQPPGTKIPQSPHRNSPQPPLSNSPTPPTRPPQTFNRPPPPRHRRADQSPGSLPSNPSGSQSPAMSDGSANAWSVIAKASKEIKKVKEGKEGKDGKDGKDKKAKKRKVEETIGRRKESAQHEDWDLPTEWELDEDGHHNMCYTCFNRKEHDEYPGMCDTCPRIYHAECHIPRIKCTMAELPDDWKCSWCLPSTPSTSVNQNFQGDDRLNCYKVLLACFEKPYYASLFIDPVDLSIEKEYKKLVEKPMDFNTIVSLLEENPRASLESERLGNVLDFINHMNIIFMNCSIYNESGTVAMDACKAVYHDFMAAVKKFLPVYKHKVFFFIHYYKATKKHSIRWRPLEGQLGEPFYDEMDHAPHVITGGTSPIRMKIKLALPRPISESEDEIHEPSSKKLKKKEKPVSQ
ncbi:unnamed protein product, partial [Mesorhabditis belari]|uniref:Uncharacterized protein n=1 Tax=Mesorhabditis belari TaxID=2138241 RepID=A0AAF3FI85_9BILA